MFIIISKIQLQEPNFLDYTDIGYTDNINLVNETHGLLTASSSSDVEACRREVWTGLGAGTWEDIERDIGSVRDLWLWKTEIYISKSFSANTM